MKPSCETIHEKVIAMEARVDTRHKLMMWFLGVVGGVMIILSTTGMTVGSKITTTLVEVSKTQAEISTTLGIVTEEVKSLREWRIQSLTYHPTIERP